MVESEPWLVEQAGRLVEVPGVVAVVLGGSRARGDHLPGSDVDLGLYYRVPLDVNALSRLARQVADRPVRVTEVGEWGPWVDGGAWLRVQGVAVDWLYRDLDRVRATWAKAQQGQYGWHAQVGHPLGVPDFAYAGEVALGVVLADPTGVLARLQREVATYPPALADALVEGLWEATFLVDGARKAIARADAAYVAGCLFRVVGLCVQALHGRAGRWLVNEKGAVTLTDRLALTPPEFAERAQELLGHLGRTPDELVASLDAAAALVEESRRACGRV